MACREQPVTCRGKIAERYGLTPSKDKSWQYQGACPRCHHGGFSITAANQHPNAPRHIWWCNCHRCKCPPELVRDTMLRDGISADCLGSYKRSSAPPADPAAMLRAAMRGVLADTKIRALADLKIRMLEVIEGKPAPADWRGFVAFAEQAGVQRSKRYDAAARWGRSATEVVPESAKSCQAGAGQGPSLRPRFGTACVPFWDRQPSRFGTTGITPQTGQVASVTTLPNPNGPRRSPNVREPPNVAATSGSQETMSTSRRFAFAAGPDETDPPKPWDPPWRSRTAHRSCDPEAARVLRRARLTCGWTVSEAARHSAVSRRMIGMLEHAQRRPSSATAEALITAYRLTGDDAAVVWSIALEWVGKRLAVQDGSRTARLVTSRQTPGPQAMMSGLPARGTHPGKHRCHDTWLAPGPRNSCP